MSGYREQNKHTKSHFLTIFSYIFFNIFLLLLLLRNVFHENISFHIKIQSLFGKKNIYRSSFISVQSLLWRAENQLYCRISIALNQKERNYLRKECTVYWSNTEVHRNSLFLHMCECQEECENSRCLGGHHTRLPRAETALERCGGGQCLSQTPLLKNPKI